MVSGAGSAYTLERTDLVGFSHRMHRSIAAIVLAGCTTASAGLLSDPRTATPPECEVRVSRTDGMGTRTRSRSYDSSGRLLGGEWSETYTGRGREELAYDAQGRIRAVRAHHDETSADYPDDMSFSADASYDERGRLALLVTVNPYDEPPRLEQRYRYDGAGRLIEISGGRGLRLSYARGRVVRSEEDWHDMDRTPWHAVGTFTYERGRLARVSYRICNPQNSCYERSSTFEHDAEGRLSAHTPSDGDAYRYHYDAEGRPTNIMMLRDNTERPREYTYDEQGRVASIVEDGNGPREERTYEGRCAAETGRPFDPNPSALLAITPCIPTRLAGCLSPDGRTIVRW